MKIKSTVLALITALSLPSPAFADVLGEVKASSGIDLGAGAYLHNVTYEGSVGKQTEYYVEYTPNDTAVPVVENGFTVWGSRTISRAAGYLSAQGYRPLVGINADFFSFATGIPMGISVSSGEILTKQDGALDAVGFRSDGNAFIDSISVKTTIYHNGESANIECINRWYTKTYTPICLLTDKFAESTHTGHSCLFLICTPTEGALSIGKEQKLHVDEKFVYDGNVEIPEGKMLLMISSYGTDHLYSFLDSINAGDEVSVYNEVEGKPEWSEAENVIGTSAGRLLANGEIGSGFEAGAAPRTAVGIRPDGTVIFYVLDGRQSGYSYGAQLTTLARRMQELGCTEAVNLDGGGSTAIGGVYPGSSTFNVFNSPSDGSLRSCANYIFLRDTRKPTGIPYHVTFSDTANKNFLDGNTLKVSYSDIYDTNGYPIQDLENVKFDVENTGGAKTTVNADGIYTFKGTGKSTVKLIANGAELTGFTYDVYAEPDHVTFVNDSTGAEVDEIYVKKDEEYSVDIGAQAYVNNTKLHAYDITYDWSIEGDIGTIDDHGVYTAKINGDKAGKIILKKGRYKKELNVFVEDYSTENEPGFADIDGHWAQPQILKLANLGIINGIESDGKVYFRPDNNMTRAEFAQIIAKKEGLLNEDYSSVSIPYTDMNDIPLWAQNAVKAVYKSGIMSGRSDNDGKTYRFDAETDITRAEAMTVLGRLIPKATPRTLDFADAADIAPWARESMERLYSEGIIRGYSDNTILPNNNVKRAEAAAMIDKF